MLRFIDQFPGLPILSLRNGRTIAKLSDPIIDPNNLTIVAFYCELRTTDGDTVVFVNDIREFSNKGIIVDSEENLMEIEGLVRLEKIIEINFSLIDKKVISDKKRKVGKVTDYTIDDRTFSIEKLYVRPTLLKNISGGDLIIGRRQIVEVNDSEVVVKDADIQVGAKKKKPAFNLIAN